MECPAWVCCMSAQPWSLQGRSQQTTALTALDSWVTCFSSSVKVHPSGNRVFSNLNACDVREGIEVQDKKQPIYKLKNEWCLHGGHQEQQLEGLYAGRWYNLLLQLVPYPHGTGDEGIHVGIDLWLLDKVSFRALLYLSMPLGSRME